MTHIESGPDAPPSAPNGAGGGPVVTMPNGPRRPPVRAYGFDMIDRARRLVVETDRSLKDIAEELGIAPTTLTNWKRLYRWERPGTAPHSGPHPDFDAELRRERLAYRVYRNLGRQLADLERRPHIGSRETAEKDARTLGVLAKTLQTLMQLDRDDGAKVKEPEPDDRDLDRLDADLAARIEAWAQGGEEN